MGFAYTEEVFTGFWK